VGVIQLIGILLGVLLANRRHSSLTLQTPDGVFGTQSVPPGTGHYNPPATLELFFFSARELFE
jgi:hypothetical protein